ncbi:hypothetical protein NDU88_001282 [Pleurodeles waltl]|uniref:Uncharacterized protein n=1 Tax=Pleurodeles waltl TaxID=8319 RepID=A0AAV7WHZ3_PLEWA|nr:hypothetical protein NDU88_001282 [Pleurodeles waltl]
MEGDESPTASDEETETDRPWCPSSDPKDPSGNLHRLLLEGSPQLIAWRITGDDGKSQDFRARLQKYFPRRGRTGLPNAIAPPGLDGWVGVAKGT